jgi:hypothetical protein
MNQMAVQIEMYDMTLFRKIQIHWEVGGGWGGGETVQSEVRRLDMRF